METTEQTAETWVWQNRKQMIAVAEKLIEGEGKIDKKIDQISTDVIGRLEVHSEKWKELVGPW